MKPGKVHLIELLDRLDRSTTIGQIFEVTKGRKNFAPEEVEDILAAINTLRSSSTGFQTDAVGRVEQIFHTKATSDQVPGVICGQVLGAGIFEVNTAQAAYGDNSALCFTADDKVVRITIDPRDPDVPGTLEFLKNEYLKTTA